MKRLFLLIFLYSVCSSISAQGWLEITDSTFGASFSLPDTPTNTYDMAHLKMYRYDVDSLLNLEADFYDSTYFSTGDTLFQEVLEERSNDTLRALADLMLNGSYNGTLDTINEFYPDSNHHGFTVEVSSTDTLLRDEPEVTYVSYFLSGHIFISFTVNGFGDDDRVAEFKNEFFESIEFFEP